MLLTPAGAVQYSPTDLIAFLEGDFAAWMERAAFERSQGRPVAEDAHALTVDADDPELALLQRAGLEHEERFLAQLRAQGRNVVEIPKGDGALAETQRAMESGAEVIFQAHLEHGDFHGYADFLFRIDTPSSFGAWQYEPWDTKLARSAKPYFLVQLCAYAELLLAAQGVLPARFAVLLGDQTERRFETGRFIHYFRHLRRVFLEFQAEFDPNGMPDPGCEGSWGRWSEAACQLLEARDHLRLVAGMTRSRIVRLEHASIRTAAALADCAFDSVPRIAPDVFTRLRSQASLQIRSRGLAQPLWEVVPPPAEEPFKGLGHLPPADPHDIYFDMEGFPFAEGGLEYLFGAVTTESAEPSFVDWWAHDEPEEKRAFEGFIDWAWQRWRELPALHIYHYAAYEVTALRKLMGKYATREDRLDDLLRHEVFVDLYQVVRQGVRVGTPSYSLKQIERLYRPQRAGTVTTAAGSVVEYQGWLDSGGPRDWRESPILRGIRDYNRDDCVSTWELALWLRDRQLEQGIPYVTASANETPTADLKPPTPADTLAESLLARADLESDPEERRVTELVAWLVGYHKREEKPTWWRLFDRRDATEEELFDDPDCLAGLERTETPPVKIKRSWGHEYRFDPSQDTKIRTGAKVCFAPDVDKRYDVVYMDEDAGRVVIRFGPKTVVPERGNLIPYEHISSEPIQEAVQRYAQRFLDTQLGVGQAVDDLLRRRRPRVSDGPDNGPLMAPDCELLPELADLIRRLDRTTLCIQGPPGTGKTWTSARVIAALCRGGKRIGVSSNSHKAVLNLLQAVAEVDGPLVRLLKVGGDSDGHPLIESGRIVECENDNIALAIATGPLVIGGTAWAFSRPELQGALDYLFVDEAGQVALANLVGMGQAARNIVLIGDQMQLAQPVQGSHPGESGTSCLVYALHGQATVPPDRGVFLGCTRRMHPEVNRFISEAVYEGRLTTDPSTDERVVVPGGGGPLERGAGIVVLEVPHEGNTQDSDEEADAIGRLLDQLRRSELVQAGGSRRPVDVARDVLVVAPYNMQVRRLRAAFPGVRVGSVDKFQGQEAPVVIVSMCSSSLEDAARGAEFLLSPNRINVAISRAQCLAVVVASPGLFKARCTSIREMELMDLFCWLREYSHGVRIPS
jgi:predicted RecB family nuclease